MSRSQWFVVLSIAGVLALTLAGCSPAAAPVPPAAPAQQAATPVPPTVVSEQAAVTAAPPATAAATVAATPAPTATAASAVSPEAPAPQSYPLTLKDDLGREVKLAARPARIVSLAPSITEILFAIGAGPRVVGVTEYCNYPLDAKQGREIVGGFSAESLSVEKIVALKPDLVFAGGAAHVQVSDALAAAGIPVFNLEPKDFPGVYTDIVAAGALTGNSPQAAQVVGGMQERIDKVSAALTSIPATERVKVFYEVWDEPLMSAGPATFIGQLVDLAGGVNIFADVQEQYPTVSSEAVVARNPQVIVGPSTHIDGLTVEKVAGRPGWAGLQAVKSGRIVIVDGDMISRPGPRLADALEAVAQGLYPERFK